MSVVLSEKEVERIIHLIVTNSAIGNMLDKDDWEQLGAVAMGGAVGASTGIVVGVILKYAIFTTASIETIILIPATLLFLLGGIAGQNRYEQMISRHRQNIANRIVALPDGNKIVYMNDSDAICWITKHAADIAALIKNQKGL